MKSLKTGVRSEKGKRARMLGEKKKKALTATKWKLTSEKTKFDSSKEFKKFRKARAEILEIPGPKERAFLELGIETYTKEKFQLGR